MRVHLLGLPHTRLTTEYSWCAYTQKIRRLAGMLHDQGVEVIVYGTEGGEARCKEQVDLVSDHERAAWTAGWDWQRVAFDRFDPSEPMWLAINDRAVIEIGERAEPGDVLGITMGWSQHTVAAAFPELFVVETGIGYSGTFAPFRVYESWAWRHYLAAREPRDDLRSFDAVIPNAYEPDEFELGDGAGGYFCFIGRLTNRKGPHIAAEACKRIGATLVVAGQGAAHVADDVIVCTDGTRIEGDVAYVGVLDADARTALMKGASATFAPTQYLEPFGGVSVESQLCGTPVIASNWGAFVENVAEGSGFRCDVLGEYVAAAELAPTLDRRVIRNRALERWSTDVVAWDYDRYFRRLQSLYGEGWYAA